MIYGCVVIVSEVRILIEAQKRFQVAEVGPGGVSSCYAAASMPWGFNGIRKGELSCRYQDNGN